MNEVTIHALLQWCLIGLALGVGVSVAQMLGIVASEGLDAIRAWWARRRSCYRCDHFWPPHVCQRNVHRPDNIPPERTCEHWRKAE